MNITLYSDNIFMNLSMIISFILFSFLSFLFATFIYSSIKRNKPIKEPENYPKLSILIPAYNEEKNIARCLKSIQDSNYNKELLEIIVVDDKSTDNTKNIVNEFANVKLIEGPHQGKAESLNLGLKHCTNELILTLDADVTLDPNTIKKMTIPMENNQVAATNAIAMIRNPKKMLEYFQMVEFCLNNIIRTSFTKSFDNSIWFFGAVACYKKSILNKIGGFKKDTLTEDMDICLEMYNHKYKIITIEDAVFYTEACKNLKELFAQRMRWYYGALQSLFKNKQLLKSDKRSAPVLFLFFNQYWWTLFAFIFFPMTAYQVYYWFPQTSTEILGYIFRWFSLSGPFYVLYKTPEWGLNLLNIFGVLSGIITFTLSVFALRIFQGTPHPKTLISLFFYFPYTIIQDAIIVAGVIKYSFSKKKYFIN